MPPTTIKARGILFDLDGTLISKQFTCNSSWAFQISDLASSGSTTICESVWHKWAEVYPVDLTEVFKSTCCLPSTLNHLWLSIRRGPHDELIHSLTGSHGIRTRELLRHWLNITDPIELEVSILLVAVGLTAVIKTADGMVSRIRQPPRSLRLTSSKRPSGLLRLARVELLYSPGLRSSS